MNKILVDNKSLFAKKVIFDKDSELLLEVDNTNKQANIELLEDISVNVTIIGNRMNSCIINIRFTFYT